MFTEGDLEQFTGSGVRYQHPLCQNVCYSDGAHYLCENGAAWLVDKIACLLQLSGKVKSALAANRAMTGLHFWKLKLDGSKATLSCVEDTGMEPIYSEEIAFTDCPFDMTLYVSQTEWLNPRGQEVTGWLIFLPSEY